MNMLIFGLILKVEIKGSVFNKICLSFLNNMGCLMSILVIRVILFWVDIFFNMFGIFDIGDWELIECMFFRLISIIRVRGSNDYSFILNFVIKI